MAPQKNGASAAQPRDSVLERRRLWLSGMGELHLNAFELDGRVPPAVPGHERDPEWGFIRSEETGCALAGPGLRTVFCLDGSEQDPGTWQPQGWRCVHVDTLVAEVEQYAGFFAAVRGGVTLSGAEPLVQHDFCVNLLRRLNGLGIHTALDTQGALSSRLGDAELRAVDLVILNLEMWDDGTPLRRGNRHVGAAIDFARRLHTLAHPTWIRFALAAGLTDHPADVAELARFCGGLTNVERLEVVPVPEPQPRRYGLGPASAISQIARPPTDEMLQSVRETFRRHGSICPD